MSSQVAYYEDIRKLEGKVNFLHKRLAKLEEEMYYYRMILRRRYV